MWWLVLTQLLFEQDISTAKSVTPLPSVYTSVPPAAMKTQHFTTPAVQRPARPPDLLAAEAAAQEEYGWLRTVTTVLQTQSFDWVWMGVTVCLPRRCPASSDPTCRYQCTVASVRRPCTLGGNDKTFHGHRQGSNSAREPWTSTCTCCWSATLRPCRGNTVDLPSHAWRGSLCNHVRRSAYRDRWVEGTFHDIQ